MLENFRSLSPGVRIIVVAIVLSVLVGIIALIPLLLFSANSQSPSPRDSVRPGATNSASAAPSQNLSSGGPVVARPQQTFTYTQPPKPTPVASGPDNPGNIKTNLSSSVLKSSYNAVKTGVVAYCTYPRGEDSEARKARLSKYFAPTSSFVSDNNDFITQQQCRVLNGVMLRGDGKNGVYYIYSLSVATQYLQSDLSDKSATADLKDYGYSVYASYTNGKWIINTIDIN